MIDISSICYISCDLIDIQFYSGFLIMELYSPFLKDVGW